MVELISVHFAKAGGTSLYVSLRNHYGASLATDYDHDPCNLAHDSFERGWLDQQVRAVHGHFRSDRYTHLRARRVITFLREPVDKLISVYFFWKTLPSCGSPDHDRFLQESPSIVEYAEQVAGKAFNAYFGGIDMELFDFIGFHHRRRSDLEELSSLLGLRISPDIHENKALSNVGSLNILSDPKTLAKLTRVLRDDIDFYNEQLSSRPRGYYKPYGSRRKGILENSVASGTDKTLSR